MPESKSNPKKQRNRIARWGLFILLGLTVIYLGIGAYAADKVTKVGEHTQYDKTPGSYGLEYSDIRFKARGDNITIAGWFIPNSETKKAIILVHGRNASKQNAISGNFPKLASELHAAGYAVLMLDLRAHGESEGKRYTFGVYERRDVLGAVDWLIAEGFNPGKIGVLGLSLGGSAVIGAAAEEKAIGAVIVDSTFADLNPLVELQWEEESGMPMFLLPGVYVMTQVMYGYNIQDVKPVNEIVNIPPRPILIIHCSTDKKVDVSHAEQLKKAVPSAELVIFEGCSHAETYRDFPDEYSTTLLSFLKEKF